MKILLCHNFYQQRGGEDRIFTEEAALLETHGHDVIRFTMHNDAIQTMGRMRLARKTIWNTASANRICRVMRSRRPDVMHCTNIFPLISPSVYYAARAERVAVVQWLQNFRTICPKAQFTRNGEICEECLGKRIGWPAVLHRCYRDSFAASAVVTAMLAYHWSTKTWTRMIARYIAPTEFSRRKHIVGGLPAERIDVKPNFVYETPKIGLGQGDCAVFVGRLSAEKGIQTLLAAWEKLPSHFRLKIVGDGPLRDSVRARCAGDERITWLGWRELDEVLDIIGDAKCLVVPSTWYEGLPRTIIESYAKGTPVVASRLGAMTEVVRDGKTGILFAPGNADDLARQLQQFVEDRKMLANARRAARDEYETRYTAEAHYRMLLSVYERAIADRRAESHAQGTPGSRDLAQGNR